MAFTMHSHSGEFCSHAVDTLEQVVQRAIAVGFTTIGLTEHMPRAHVADLYPEEIGDDPEAALAGLAPRFDAYLREALRLRDAYADRITVLVGFETEWIRGGDAEDGARIRALAARPGVDYFVGSVHHVCGTPIDYDKTLYAAAAAAAQSEAAAAAAQSEAAAAQSEAAAEAGTAGPGTPEVALFARYYDDQLAMLQALRPRVVGHVDLVRLLSAAPDAAPAAVDPSGALWARIERNLAFVAGYGGWLEVNTAALRKGLAEPYPGRAVAEAWLRLGGRFTLSDDSHGTAHVATNYRRGLAYLARLGVAAVWTLARGADGRLEERSVSLADVAASLRLGGEEGEEA